MTLKKSIANKIEEGAPLSFEELMFLYDLPSLSDLASLAQRVRKRFNGENVYYNRNFHLEPSNVCIHRCEFCSFRREREDESGAWSLSLEEVRAYCREKYEEGVTEVHVVGSVHPSKKFDYYLNIIKILREELPDTVAIKAYSAVEISDMCRDGLTLDFVLSSLKGAGLSAIPGGGAEIFSQRVRDKICPDKISAERWLEVHETAHGMGLHSNATMLFGHIESREERVEHILRIRELQERSGGFDAFIPLKYLAANNIASTKYGLQELSTPEVLRTFAISRIALNNIPHIKAYWAMLGKEITELALLFGADDIDGTLNDSTKIYSLAGGDQNPTMSVSELKEMAKKGGFKGVERDSFYRIK